MTDTLHVIGPDDSITTMLMTPDLTGPNGLLYTGDYLTVVGFNGNDMFNVPFEGPNAGVVYTFEFGMLDGIVAVPGGMLVSTWDAASPGVYILLSNDFSDRSRRSSRASTRRPTSRSTSTATCCSVPVLLQNRAEFYPL
jgi:hypothetical protein